MRSHIIFATFCQVSRKYMYISFYKFACDGLYSRKEQIVHFQLESKETSLSIFETHDILSHSAADSDRARWHILAFANLNSAMFPRLPLLRE